MSDRLSVFFYQADVKVPSNEEPAFAPEPPPAFEPALELDLRALCASTPAIQRAYFARLASPWPPEALCFKFAQDSDPEIANRCTFIWKWHRGRSAPLVVCFLTPSVEKRLAANTAPFYAAA